MRLSGTTWVRLERPPSAHTRPPVETLIARRRRSLRKMTQVRVPVLG